MLMIENQNAKKRAQQAHYFNDTSAGIFCYGYKDRNGIPVRDTFGAMLRVKMHGLGSVDWTQDQMKDFIAKYSSAEMAEIMLEEDISELIKLAKTRPSSFQVTKDEQIELNRFVSRAIRQSVRNGASPASIRSAIDIGWCHHNLSKLSGLEFSESMIKVRATKIADLYDDNRELSGLLSEAIDNFEYPDWSYRTIGDALSVCGSLADRVESCAVDHICKGVIKDGYTTRLRLG